MLSETHARRNALITEAARLLREFFDERTAITKNFMDRAKTEFPQFDVKVILCGVGTGSTISEPIRDSTLVNVGVYTASALLDPRPKSNARSYKSLSGEKIDAPVLSDLFPWLRDGSEQSKEILDTIGRFSDFRFHNLEERYRLLDARYDQIVLAPLKKNFPGLSDAEYHEAIQIAWRG